MTTESSARNNTGLVVTFYSFKGGTGRSMALANVAWILASSGHRVLVMDWDLESPGLHRYFHPFLVDKTLKSSPGVLDLVRDFAAATLEPTVGRGDRDWFRKRARILPYASSLDWDFPRKGSIDFVPAGRQTSSYTQAVSTFEWDDFYYRLGGGAFLDALREDMRAQYDYVLIDSRTGLSDTAGICTVNLPDIVVDCFTLSSQSIDGAAAVAQSIISQRGDRHIRILPVIMRTDASEKGKLDAGREAAQAKFTGLLAQQGLLDATPYWSGAEVPYVPFYAFEEILAPFGDSPGQPTSLLAAFERLAANVTDGAVTRLAPMDDHARRHRLVEFERARRVRLPDVVLSYSAWDRLWAEWVRAELVAAGFRVTPTCVELARRKPEQPLGVEPVPETTLALLSYDYVKTPQAMALWQDLAARKRHSGMVAVHLDGVPAPDTFDRQVSADLSGLSEPEARERLLFAVGQGPVIDDGGSPATEPARGTVRFPGAIPRTFSVPPRNDLFTGRATILEELRDRFNASGAEVQPQLLYGLGGVGKTQIAIEYAHRFAADYDIVWWISAEQPGLTRAALARLAPILGLPSGNEQATDIENVLTEMRATDPRRRWLLIFDNAEDAAELTKMLPSHGHIHVLITSRTPGASSTTSIEVTVFSRDHSISLLLRRAEGVAPADADAVAERLGDLPLAIEQAGAWLAATGMSVSAYLDLLDTRLSDVLGQRKSPDYPHTVAATWLLSLDRLRAQRPAAARLMELCACFASEPIPTRLLLKEPATSLLAEFDPDLRDPMLLAQLFQEVVRYSLARVDSAQGTLEVHRLVQVVIRQQMEPDLRTKTERSVLDILVAANPGDTDKPGNWPQYAEIWPHVSARAMASEAREVRLLILDMVRYLWRSGDRSTGKDLAERAIAQWAPVFGEDDATTLRTRDELSNVLHTLGEFKLALKTSENVVERMTRTLGANHPYTLISMNSLTGRLLADGQYARAEQLSQEILEPTRTVFGRQHPRALYALNSVVSAARFTGDLREATRLNEQLYDSRKEVYGANYPDTLITAVKLGRDYRELGEFTKSRSRLESAVQDLTDILGKDHLDTIRARANFAVTWRKLGEFNNAHGLSTAALDRALRELGARHPECQAIGLNLACDDAALGRYENAIARTSEIFEQYLESFGVEHYLPFIAMNNLAVFTRLAGRRSDALNLSRRSWDGLARVFGASHPSTLSAQVNHANDLFSTGDREQARELDEMTYGLMRGVLGDHHPDTLAAGGNLATDLRSTGDIDSAETLREQVLRAMIEKLGERHPNCHAVRSGERLNCDIEQPLI